MNRLPETEDPTATGSEEIRLRREAEATGAQLADALAALLAGLPGRPRRPRTLSDALGITTVTASRLLRAVELSDPVAVLHQIPGAVPLRRTIDASEALESDPALVERAREATTRFEALVRSAGGHRSSLNTILSHWLPEGRRVFEIRRRQAAYKAISELKGVHCQWSSSTIALRPSTTRAGWLDLLTIQCTLGLDRLSPDSPFCLATHRLSGTLPDEEVEPGALQPPRGPRSLDGEWIVEGAQPARLDQFCGAKPAPIEMRRVGDETQYLLGSTGIGPNSSVDLIVAQHYPGEVPDSADGKPPRLPYFYFMPAGPAQHSQFDLLVHDDVYPGHDPEFVAYDAAHRGPARCFAPEREVDRLRVSETIEPLGHEPARLRTVEFPRYTDLVAHAFTKLGWEPREFRAYRLSVSYPLHGMQLCMGFRL